MTHPDSAPAILVFLMSAGALLGAYGFQYIGGLDPCILCLYQRIPHAVVLVLTVAAIFMVGRPPATLWLTVLAGLTLLVGAGIAGFHVGVEQKWWEGTAECGSSGTPDSLEALRAQILSQPVARCDEVPWSLFGISMAGYNMLISAAAGVFALWNARRITRTRSLS